MGISGDGGGGSPRSISAPDKARASSPPQKSCSENREAPNRSRSLLSSEEEKTAPQWVFSPVSSASSLPRLISSLPNSPPTPRAPTRVCPEHFAKWRGGSRFLSQRYTGDSWGRALLTCSPLPIPPTRHIKDRGLRRKPNDHHHSSPVAFPGLAAGTAHSPSSFSSNTGLLEDEEEVLAPILFFHLLQWNIGGGGELASPKKSTRERGEPGSATTESGRAGTPLQDGSRGLRVFVRRCVNVSWVALSGSTRPLLSPPLALSLSSLRSARRWRRRRRLELQLPKTCFALLGTPFFSAPFSVPPASGKRGRRGRASSKEPHQKPRRASKKNPKHASFLLYPSFSPFSSLPNTTQALVSPR